MRDTALRLPAIRRLRIAATISSSVRSGWLAIRHQQKLRVLLQRRDAAAAWLCCNAACLLETLHPDHHHAGADSIAFGRLAPRGTGLNVFQSLGHCTEFDGIGLRHRSLQKQNQCRHNSLINKALAILPILAPSEICSKSRDGRERSERYTKTCPSLMCPWSIFI